MHGDVLSRGCVMMLDSGGGVLCDDVVCRGCMECNDVVRR